MFFLYGSSAVCVVLQSKRRIIPHYRGGCRNHVELSSMTVTMKAFISKSIMLASAILALASCSKEQLVKTEISGETHEFSASMPFSKTALGDKGEDNTYPNLWTAGDQISVNGYASDALAQDYDGLSHAIFAVTGDISSPYLAVYPAAVATSFDTSKKTVTVTVPSGQTYVAGTYDPAAYIMTASSEDGSFAFESVMTILKLTPTGDSGTIESVSVKSLGGKQISGVFSYSYTSKALTAMESGNSIVVTGPADGIQIGTPWYICLPAADYTSGLEITVVAHNKTSMTVTATPAKAYEAGKMYAATLLYAPDSYTIASQADIDAITLSEGNRIDVKNLICEGAGVTDLVWSNIKTKVKTVENLSCDGCSFTMLGNFFKGGANTDGVEVTGNIVLKNLCTGDGQFLNSDNVPTSIGGDMIIENVRVHGWANAGFNMVTEIAGDLCIKTNVMANNAAFTLLKTVGGDMTLDGISIGFNGGRVWNIAGWTIENIAGKLTVQNTQYVDFQGFEKIKSIGSIYVKNNPIPTATFGTVQGWIDNGVVAYENVECYDANGNKVKFNNYPAGSRIITSQADLDAITGGPIVVENLVLAGSNITTTLLANVKNKISSIKNLYVDACAATSLNNLLSTVPVTGDITLKDVCPCTGATYFTSAGFPTEIGGSLVLENVRMHGWAGMGFDKITSIAGNLVIRTEICTTTVTFIGLKSVGGDLILDGIQKGNGGGTVFNCSGWSVENIGGKLSITNTAFNSFTGFTALKSIGSVYLKGNNFSDFSTVQGWINNGVVAYGNVECYKADGSRVTFTDKN